MKPRTRIPYGISNYENLVEEGYYFVDKTEYIEQLENLNEKILFFLRPRKFGKSLFVSLLQHYYGIEYKDKFNQLFGGTYIVNNPTRLANKYFILKFDFSGINTGSTGKTFGGFTEKVQDAIKGFQNAYGILPAESFQILITSEDPERILVKFFREFEGLQVNGKLYILIDEYDHFTNELISFRLNEFKSIVSRNGYVRKFYEVIKSATRDGIVDRFFATGVTPVTLDSMTSGFNIGSDLTIAAEFNEMLGFTGDELQRMLNHLRVAASSGLLSQLQDYYNGSLFSMGGRTRLYNPNMVVYYLNEYSKRQHPPDELVDSNIASDYSKIKNIFTIGDSAVINQKLKEIIGDGETAAVLIRKFSFERDFTADDFISLLFYNGLLTIKEEYYGKLTFRIPNYVIREIYWDFFRNRLENEAQLQFDSSRFVDAVVLMARDGSITGLVKEIETVLETLSNLDFRKFDEKYIKLLMIAFSLYSPVYMIKSEPEVEGEYPDLLFLTKGAYKANYQFLVELKYLPKAGKTKFATVKREAKAQVQRYLQKPEIRSIQNLKAFTVIFVGKSAQIEEIVNLIP